MRVLFIGGSGLVGKAITREFVAHGDDLPRYNRGRRWMLS